MMTLNEFLKLDDVRRFLADVDARARKGKISSGVLIGTYVIHNNVVYVVHADASSRTVDFSARDNFPEDLKRDWFPDAFAQPCTT